MKFELYLDILIGKIFEMIKKLRLKMHFSFLVGTLTFSLNYSTNEKSKGKNWIFVSASTDLVEKKEKID